MHVTVWVARALIVGASVAMGLVVWWMLNPPRPIRWTPSGVTIARWTWVRPEGLQQGWLTLTGLPLRPQDVRHLGWLVGVVTTIGLTVGLHNILIGVGFGLIGLILPEAVIRYLARKRWQQLDFAAYVAAHMLQAKLQLRVPVLEAFRALLPESGEPFRSWMAPCLSGEARGTPLEVTLKRQASLIQHIELTTLADILSAERTHGQAAPIVARAVDLWSARIHGDAVRRGTLAGSTMLGYGVVLIGIAAFWGIVIFSPTVRDGLNHGLGFWTTGIGACLIAGAGFMQNRISRQAEAI